MNIILSLLSPIASLSYLVDCTEQSKDALLWTNMFNGKTIENWKQLGGAAKYEVRDEMLLGVAMNLGIRIRSNRHSDYRNGGVHGCQVETDPIGSSIEGGQYGTRCWAYALR